MPCTIRQAVHSELIIKKSRFIGCVQPVPNRTAAQQIVHHLWQQHPNAAHVCWALLAGGQSAAVDDGEPSGTAGRPMLEVLRHQDFDGVLATVVRYFGGVKLGTGGLVSAYTDCIAQAVKQAEIVPIVRWHIMSFEVPYHLEGAVRRLITQHHTEIGSVTHGNHVQFELQVAEQDRSALFNRLTELGQGKLVWTEASP